MNNLGADQTAWMNRLICVFAYNINRFSHDMARFFDGPTTIFVLMSGYFVDIFYMYLNGA